MPFPLWARPQSPNTLGSCFVLEKTLFSKKQRKASEQSSQVAQTDSQPVRSNTPPWRTMLLGGAAGSHVTRRKRQTFGTDDDKPATLYEKIDALILMIKAGIIAEDAFESSLNKIMKDETSAKPPAQVPQAQQVEKNKKHQSWTESSQTTAKQWDGQWEDQKAPPKDKAAQVQWEPQKHRKVTSDTAAADQKRTNAAQIRGFVTSEWTVAPIVSTFEACQTAIRNGQASPGNLIEVDWQQYEDIKDMLSAFEIKTPVTLLWRGRYITSDTQKTARVRAKTSEKGHFTPTQITCETWNEGPMPKPPTQAAIATSDISTKVTVRITAPECYRAIHFSDNKGDNPSKLIACIHQWQLGITPSQLTGGSWVRQWTKKGIQLVGHLRLKEAHANLLLENSGRHAIFFTKTGDRTNQKKVSWFTREKQESDETYFRRAQQQASKKAIRFRAGGGNDLGVDQDSEADAPVRRHWKLQGTPSTWDEADLCSFLEKQKWTEVRIAHRRKAGKHKATWFLTSHSPDKSDDMIIYEDSQYTMLINTCAAPRRSTAKAWEYIPAPKKQWGKNGKPPEDKDGKPDETQSEQRTKKQKVAEVPQSTFSPATEAVEVAATALDVDEEETQKDKKREAPGETDLAYDTAKGSFPENVQQAKLHGWSEKDAGGDGDCFSKLLSPVTHMPGIKRIHPKKCTLWPVTFECRRSNTSKLTEPSTNRTTHTTLLRSNTSEQDSHLQRTFKTFWTKRHNAHIGPIIS